MLKAGERLDFAMDRVVERVGYAKPLKSDDVNLLTASAEKSDRQRKTVMLWASHPCTPQWSWPSRCNSTMIATFIRELMPLRDVVDRIAVNGYYIADPANATAPSFNGGLIRYESLPLIVATLQQAGFLVEPLVGNGPSCSKDTRRSLYAT
eukprot:COSAG01_NODE_11911_length_1836_cov_10.918250_2_plen_151_part_00